MQVRGDQPGRSAPPDDEPPPIEPEDTAGERALTPTLVVTLVWYLIPGVLYAAWTTMFPPVSGMCDGGDAACGSAMSRIGHGIGTALPWLAAAVTCSLLIAVLLRLPKTGWRAGAGGTAAAVIGAGLTTVILKAAGYDLG